MARPRRAMARLARARPERSWAVRVHPPRVSRTSTRPIHAPWSRRLHWSPGAWPVAAHPTAHRQADRSMRRTSTASLRSPGTRRRWRASTGCASAIGAWRAPTPGWVGRLGPITGVTRAEMRVPHIGPARVRVHLDLTHPRPIREVIGAVMDLLVPGAPMPFPQSPSVGANGGCRWLPVAADTAGHFLGSALTFAVDGTPVDVVSGIKRNPDNPPPNRPAADAELVMPGDSPEGFGVAPIPSLAVSGPGHRRGRLDRNGAAGRSGPADPSLACRRRYRAHRSHWRCRARRLAGPRLAAAAPTGCRRSVARRRGAVARDGRARPVRLVVHRL